MNIALDEWKELEPEQKKAPTSAPVRFGLVQFRNGPRRGRILLKREIIDRLQMSDWRVNIRIGSGPNKFRLAVIPATDGRFELAEVGLQKGGGTWRLQMPPIDAWSDYPMKMSEPVWSIDKIFGKTQALFIELPAPLVDNASFLKWKAASNA